MKTELLTQQDVSRAAEILQKGGLVGIPTETVYGLGANGFDPEAVAHIFQAKGRPQDNPLILHIPEPGWLERCCQDIPAAAWTLAERFWPGPMTMVLPKATCLSDEVTAGLPTVGIRFPAHPAAQAIIRESGLPLAAPSANLSGSPSPTRASHVYDDLQGKIPLIIDGGACAVGLESTVIAVMEDRIRLLRPGGITAEQLRAYAPVEIDDGVLHQLDEGTKAASPGMKYKHYSPKAKVIIVDAPLPDFASFVNARRENGVYAMVFDGEEALLQVPTLSFGVQDDQPSQAKVLFDSLRRCDELGAKTVYVRAPQKDGIGLAVYNRLLRAAAFRVQQLG